MTSPKTLWHCILLLSLTVPTLAQNTEAPIPDIATLMHDVEHNQRASEDLRKHYFYRATTRTEETDNKGRIKRTETRVNEIFTREGVVVSRLIEKDGKPLSEKEAQKEDERIEKDIEKAIKKREKLQNEGKPTNGNGEDVLTISRILALGTFTNPRRQMFHGRPTIVVDYAGDRNAKTRNRLEDVFKLLAGTIWIDEQTRALVRGEGHVTDNFHVGGGLLVNVHEGFRFSFEQTYVNNEVWLPSVVEGEGSARMFLFFKIQGRLRTTFSNYRKFNASSTILPGVTEVENGPANEDSPQK